LIGDRKAVGGNHVKMVEKRLKIDGKTCENDKEKMLGKIRKSLRKKRAVGLKKREEFKGGEQVDLQVAWSASDLIFK
jgi:hypothetical protein